MGFQLPLHPDVHLGFMIVIAGQRRMDLSQREMWMGCVDLLRVPTISDMVHRDLDDLCVRIPDPGDSALVTPYVSDWLDYQHVFRLTGQQRLCNGGTGLWLLA